MRELIIQTADADLMVSTQELAQGIQNKYQFKRARERAEFFKRSSWVQTSSNYFINRFYDDSI